MWNLKLLTSTLTISVVPPSEIHLPGKAHLFAALTEAKDRAGVKARQGGSTAGSQYGAQPPPPIEAKFTNAGIYFWQHSDAEG